MKIKEIETFILKTPIQKPFYSASMKFDYRSSLIVKITTDKGLVGWGEAGQFGPPELPNSVIKHIYRPLLLGENPFENERLWRKMYSQTRDYGQTGSVIEAISGIDIALWDIKGKAFDVPIYNLLGAKYRKEVQTYATGLYHQPDYSIQDYLDEAKVYVNKGFKGIKIKIGSNSIQKDLSIIEAFRKEFGNDFLIMTDANHAYNTQSAIKIGKEMEKYDVYWFEEPVIPEDIEGYIEIKNSLNMSIAGGECVFTPYGFKDLITKRAVNIAQPDLSVTGGFTAVRKIVDLAELYGILVMPHLWGSAVTFYATLQLLASIPDIPPTNNPRPGLNQPMFEYEQTENPLREHLAGKLPDLVGGKVKIPDDPGLGIEIDMNVLNEYIES